MTRNQILYQENLERKRANKATETETARANKAREYETNRNNIVVSNEQARANRARESLTAASNEETKRSNMAREAETAQHNRATEGLGFAQLTETKRSNKANEALTASRNAETQRHNVQSERLGAQQNLTKRLADLEQARHNQVVESETERANKAREEDTDVRNTQDFLLGYDTLTNRTEIAELQTGAQRDIAELRALTDRAINGEKIDAERARTLQNNVFNFVNTLIRTLGGNRNGNYEWAQ